MSARRFLTIFNDFDTVHLCKDVGAIPYHLSAVCGWEATLAFFEGREHLLEALRGTREGRRIRFLSLGKRGNRVRNVVETLFFLARHGKEYDVLNFYHDGLLPISLGLLFKAVRRGGVVYSKLDMSHLELERILRIRERLLPRLARRVRGALSRLAVDLYTVEVSSVFDRLADDPYFRGRLARLPNGFTPESDPDPAEWFARKENVVLAVGRIGAHEKWHELLVDAVSAVPPDALAGWKVLFVGPVVSEPFQRRVAEAVAANPRLGDVFVLRGEIRDREELHDVYRKAKIFCLTSRWESFGFVLLEAMRFGNYVIASDLPAPRDMTRDGSLGALFPVGDAAKLAELLTEAITGKIDLAAMGMESRRYARGRFDWRVIVPELDRLLTGALRLRQGG